MCDLKSLSKSSNQLEVSILLANFFSEEDLDNICAEALSLNFRPPRDIDIEEVTIFKYINFSNEKELEIKDIILLKQYPPVRYIDFIFTDTINNIYKDLRFNYNPSVYKIMNKILADAYNFAAYIMDTLTETSVDKKMLYVNFSKKVIDMFSDIGSDIVLLKYIITSILNNGLFYDKNTFIKVYNITPIIQLELVTISLNIIKLTIHDKVNRAYLFIDRSIQGLAQLRLVFDFILKDLHP